MTKLEFAKIIYENEELTDKQKLSLIREITQRQKDLLLWGWVGAEIKVRLNKEYKACKDKCMKSGGNRNVCVEKCRNEYYAKREKAVAAAKVAKMKAKAAKK